jgi:hypothetical protein
VPLILGAGAIITSGGFIVSNTIRNASPIYQSLGAVAFIWQVTLLAGGVLTVEGVRRGKPKHEAGGLVLIAGGIIMYVIGIMWARGVAGWTAGILLTVTSIAILARAHDVIQGRPWS